MAVGLSDPVYADQDQERKAKANSGRPTKLQQLRTAEAKSFTIQSIVEKLPNPSNIKRKRQITKSLCCQSMELLV